MRYTLTIMNTLARCYQILEVRPGASLEEIKHAYHAMVKAWHPDRFPGDDEAMQKKAHQKLLEVNGAYEKLCDYYKAFGEEEARRAQSPHSGSDKTKKTYHWGDETPGRERSSGPPPRRPVYQQRPVIRTLGSLYTLYFYGVTLILIGFAVVYHFFTPFIPEFDPFRNYVASDEDQSVEAAPESEEPIDLAPRQANNDRLEEDFSQAVDSQKAMVASLPIVPKPTIVSVSKPERMTKSFTVGSTKQEVVDAQGWPEDITRDRIAHLEIWHYGDSNVSISTIDNKVAGWDNRGKNLRNYLHPPSGTSSRDYIIQGSNKDDVLRIQGEPDRITRYSISGYEVWRYGYSSIIFSTQTDSVIQWINTNKNLRISDSSGITLGHPASID